MTEKSSKPAEPEPAPLVRVEVAEDTLVCKHTPAGLWICCSEKEPARCALGLTPTGAAAHWERVQQTEE